MAKGCLRERMSKINLNYMLCFAALHINPLLDTKPCIKFAKCKALKNIILIVKEWYPGSVRGVCTEGGTKSED